ncbi:hypothetical protein [uncultured Polaribacter sp.]|uniref:hypothetical protein n=1 Tax=uncultured Polaribacter sp. TaxID=174711 RepID=UPI0032B2D978
MSIIKETNRFPICTAANQRMLIAIRNQQNAGFVACFSADVSSVLWFSFDSTARILEAISETFYAHVFMLKKITKQWYIFYKFTAN